MDHLQQLALAIRALLLMRFKFNERKRFVQITLISIWNDLDSFMDSFRHVISKRQVDRLVTRWECAPPSPAKTDLTSRL